MIDTPLPDIFVRQCQRLYNGTQVVRCQLLETGAATQQEVPAKSHCHSFLYQHPVRKQALFRGSTQRCTMAEDACMQRATGPGRK